MRFSEKSFEIRFCAALSAVCMPFNANPQWFGFTQAQERKAGIDAMINMGGRLIIFQFKAQNKDGRFEVERRQFLTLKKFTNRHKDSVFYIFSGLKETLHAAKIPCIFYESWVGELHEIEKLFSSNTYKYRKLGIKYKNHVPLKCKLGSAELYRFCMFYGFFCMEKFPICIFQEIFEFKEACIDRDGNVELSFLIDGKEWRFDYKHLIHDITGIPIGRDVERREDGRAITSVEQFEEMLGEKAHKNLWKGLWGFFIPDRKPGW